jgi:hypothetical protein
MRLKQTWNKFVESINEIFGDDRFIYKFGFIFGLNFALNLLNIFIRLVGWSVDFWPASISQQTTDFLNTLFSSILPIGISILTLPAWIYRKGYRYMISDRIRKQKYPLLPEHGSMKRKMSIGSVFLTINYTLTLPIALVSMVPFVLLMTMQEQLSQPQNIGLFLAFVVGSIVITLLFSIVLLLIGTVLVPCLMYIYLRKKSVAEAFKTSNVIKIIKNSFLAWIILFVTSLGVGIIFALIRLFLCIIAPLVNPFIQTFGMLLHSTAVGAIYSQLEDVSLD